jgi:hypothetical protein
MARRGGEDGIFKKYAPDRIYISAFVVGLMKYCSRSPHHYPIDVV